MVKFNFWCAIIYYLIFCTECKFKEYVITDTMASYSDTQTACKNMEGEMASEDLKDRLLANLLKKRLRIIYHKNNIFKKQLSKIKNKVDNYY